MRGDTNIKCRVVFGHVLFTESNLIHFLVPTYLLRSVAFSSSPFCIQNSISIFRRCRLRVILRAHWVYENLFGNLLNFSSLGCTVAKNCRGIYGTRVRCGVRLACCDVILRRVSMKAVLRNVLSAFSVSPPLTSVCICQTAWPHSREQRKAFVHIRLWTYGRSPVTYIGTFLCRKPTSRD